MTLLGGFLVFVASLFMAGAVPKAFFPKEDRSEFNISYTLPEGTSLEGTETKVFALLDEIQKYPGVKRVVSTIASGQDRKPNAARLNVQLVNREARTFSQNEFMNRIREELGPKYNTEGSEFLVADAGGGGGGRNEPIQYIFQSGHWDKLVTFTNQVREHVAKNVPGAVDVITTQPKAAQEYSIIVDQGRAADLGVSTGQIGQAVRALYEGDKISDINSDGKTVDVRLRVGDKDRLGPADLSGVTVKNNRGEVISLTSIAEIRLATAPSKIERFNRQRQITLVSNFTGKDLQGATVIINDFLAKNMPPEITYSLSGQVETMQEAMVAMLKALVIAILLVYMILCAQYEGYLAPLVIMAALPLSLAGAFGSLLLTGQVMSIYAMIGIILLMGLVTKNGILLIDFTIQRMKEGGLSVYDALMEAGPVRLRPILMTTFAAGGGMLPIAVGHGVGGEARSPMGVAVIGGLLLSTLLTLVVVPCLFSVVEEVKEKIARRRRGYVPQHSAEVFAHPAHKVKK